jgi:hypothetical protein
MVLVHRVRLEDDGDGVLKRRFDNGFFRRPALAGGHHSEGAHHRAEQKYFLHIQFILEITNQSSPAAALRQAQASELKTKRKSSRRLSVQFVGGGKKSASYVRFAAA